MVFELPSAVPKSGPGKGQQTFENSIIDNQRQVNGRVHNRGQNGRPAHLTYGPKEGRRMVGNVIGVSVAMMLIFTAHRSVTGITVTDNFDWPGISAFRFDLLVFILSALFLPTILIRFLSVRWVILIAVVIYGIHTVEQFYWTNFTSKFFDLIVNIWSIPLWTAVCTYLSHIGHEYSKLGSKHVQIPVVKFFGIFYLFYHTCGILGAFIRSPDSDSLEEAIENNVSTESGIIVVLQSACGTSECGKSSVDFDYGDHDPFFMTNEETTVDSKKMWTLAALSVVFALVSALILFFRVDSLKRYGERERENKPRTLQLLFATCIHLKNPYQILLIPLTFWMSLQQCFFTSDYLINYVKCSWTDDHAVQYILISYGVAAALSSMSISTMIHRAVPDSGRMWSFGLAGLIHVILIIVLLVWTPHEVTGGHAGLSALAFLWGIADGIWLVELSSLYGSLFHKNVPEAAFANYHLWRVVGTLMAVVIFNCFCLSHKLCCLLAVLGLGLLGIGAIEVIERRRNRNA